MTLLPIEYNPSRRQLAVFGVVWLVVFGVLGGFACYRGGWPWATVLWAAALAVPGIGWVFPALLRVVYVGMACLTYPVGVVVSFVVLAAIYYLVFTPVGLLLRLFGYDPMHRRRDAGAVSYWVARQPTEDVRRYFQQF